MRPSKSAAWAVGLRPSGSSVPNWKSDSICAADTITARTKVAGFQETTGSLGLMLITKRETTYTNQDGKIVAKMYGTLIQY